MNTLSLELRLKIITTGYRVPNITRLNTVAK